MIKVCKICGKEFESNRNKICCSKACMSENNRLLCADNNNKQREKRARVKKNMQSIIDLTVEARKHGMSYGQYVAQMHMKGR